MGTTRAAVVFLLLFCASGCNDSQQPAPPPPPEQGYQYLDQPSMASFNLRFRVAEGATGTLRMIFAEPKTDDGFFIELGPQGALSGTAHGGDDFVGVRENRHTLSGLAGKQLVFERRPQRWGLSADGRLILSGDAPPEPGRRIGLLARGGSAHILDLRVQPVSEVFFADGFMRTAEDPTSWTEVRGTWTLHSLNPLLSANAFNYGAVGDPEAAAVTGEWFWSDIELTAACRPASKGAVGLYVCYRGPEDYFLFRWSARDAERSVRQFIRKKGDSEAVLAESETGYAPDQWYKLGVLLGSGWAQVFVNEQRVMSVRDPELTFGKIGLYAAGDKETLFDDVRAELRPATLVDFDGYRLGGWLASGGEWIQVKPLAGGLEDWPGGVMVAADEPSRIVWGHPTWENYAIRARLGPWEKGALGFCFRYQDSANYYTARWKKASEPVVELWRTENGKDTLLESAPVAEDGLSHAFGVATRDDVIEVSVDGRPLLATADNAFTCGRVGLHAENIESGQFTDVMYGFLPAPKPLAKHKQAFSAEKVSDIIMWADPLSDWLEGRDAREDGTNATVYWRRCDFHGDARIGLRLSEPLPAGAEIGLACNGTGKGLKQGLWLRLRQKPLEENSDGPFVLDLHENGELVADAEFAWPAGPRMLSLRRTGHVVGVLLGERTVLAHRLTEEPEGRKIGYYAAGTEIPADNVDVYSENVLTYAFEEAPTDWRTAGGTWEVANKWECDPRWSFFSGRYDKDSKAAVLWNRRPLYGDFTIEYYIGNKMERARGSQYEYARDMNLVVCADGRDATSGYSCVFGGYSNTVSGIFRGPDPWGAPDGLPPLINRRNLHRKWYHFTVTRRGDRIEMLVSEQDRPDEVVASRTDDDPLSGARWGIWTYDNGITIGRIRVSAEKIGPLESPDEEWPETAETMYDAE